MKIFDAHCDVLYKMYLDGSISFQNSMKLQVNLNYLMMYPTSIQCFAIYVPETIKFENRFQASLDMIHIFYEKILKEYENIKLIKTNEDMLHLKNDEIGAMLTLEGCDAIGADIAKLDTLIRLGVSSIGLTWNFANLVADGAKEKRNGGLTNFGRKVVRRNNEKKMWTDVSHLCERSFWDTMEIANYPIASHSNCQALHMHPRNLSDEQIKAIIQKNGVIGITFVPSFLDEHGNANITDIIKNIEYVCSLGGENNVGFGSDFDGTDERVRGLSNYSNYAHLFDEMTKYYNDDQIRKFSHTNFINHFPR